MFDYSRGGVSKSVRSARGWKILEISFLWVSAGYVPPGLLAGGAKATGTAASIGEFLGRRKPGLPDGGDALFWAE